MKKLVAFAMILSLSCAVGCSKPPAKPATPTPKAPVVEKDKAPAAAAPMEKAPEKPAEKPK